MNYSRVDDAVEWAERMEQRDARRKAEPVVPHANVKGHMFELGADGEPVDEAGRGKLWGMAATEADRAVRHTIEAHNRKARSERRSDDRLEQRTPTDDEIERMRRTMLANGRHRHETGSCGDEEPDLGDIIGRSQAMARSGQVW